MCFATLCCYDRVQCWILVTHEKKILNKNIYTFSSHGYNGKEIADAYLRSTNVPISQLESKENKYVSNSHSGWCMAEQQHVNMNRFNLNDFIFNSMITQLMKSRKNNTHQNNTFCVWFVSQVFYF